MSLFGYSLGFGNSLGVVPTFILLTTNSHLTTTTCQAQAKILTTVGGVDPQTGLSEEIGTKETMESRDIGAHEMGTGTEKEIGTEVATAGHALVRHSHTAHNETAPIHEALPDRQGRRIVVVTKRDANEVDRVLVLGLYRQMLRTLTIIKNISGRRTSIGNGVAVGRGRKGRRRKRIRRYNHFHCIASSSYPYFSFQKKKNASSSSQWGKHGIISDSEYVLYTL